METRAYAFGTANKRSTMLDNKTIEFPKEEDHSPRVLILKKECRPDYDNFHHCLSEKIKIVKI